MRIVSLVPNGTEILFAIGAGGDVVGVSHECDHPAAARRLPVLTGSTLTPGMSAAEIDRAVSAQLASGESLYTLAEEEIARLAPDLIVTQHLCPVCAVSTAQVDGALAAIAARAAMTAMAPTALPPTPRTRCPDLLSLDPRTLADVLADIVRSGEATGRLPAATTLVAALQDRLDDVRRRVAGRPRPRVLALEWLDPPFAAGHWVPEMIEAAGGLDVIGSPGSHAPRLSWEQVEGLDPDIVVAMPCGFDAGGAAAQIAAIAAHPPWNRLRAARTGRVHAVDANGCFSRPGPRLLDGIDELARIFHPE
jgi:iron complex transport system substrate-binding protein